MFDDWCIVDTMAFVRVASTLYLLYLIFGYITLFL